MATTTIPNLPKVTGLTGSEQIPAVPISTSGVPGQMVAITSAQIAALAPAGTPGPQGPQGPAGPEELNVTSPDGSLIVSGTGTQAVTLTAGLLAGGENVLPGVYLYASLPSPASYPFHFASTSDQGAVYSTGTAWQILYNITGATIQISTGTPLPPGANGTNYSQQLSATLGTPPYTWSLVASYAVSGTANTFALSSTGLLTSTAPPNNSTTALVVQVQDSTGAVAPQKTLTVQIQGTVTPAATPTFSPAAGLYHSAQSVTISCSTSGSTIFYTTNGSTPTTSSTVYTSPISVSANQTVQAIATAAGYTQSAVGSAAYVISLTNPLGTNLQQADYYNTEQPFLNVWKQAGSFSTRTAGSNAETNEEGFLASVLDSDGYPTTLTVGGIPGGQRFGQLLIGTLAGLQTPAGASTPYPSGTYLFQFQGNGILQFTNDVTAVALVSGSVTVSSKTVTSSLAAGATGVVSLTVSPSTSGIYVIMKATDQLSAGNYLKAFACYQQSLLSNFNAGQIFHPNFLAEVQNYSCVRYKDWLRTDVSWVTYGVIGGSIPSGSTSAVAVTGSANTITNVTNGANAVVTISSSSNPFSAGNTVVLTGVTGTSNNTWGYITAVGGSSGAYTLTTNITTTSSSTTGSAYLGATWEYASQTRNVYFSDGEIKAATFTAGSPAISWTGGLTNTITSTYVNDDWYCQYVILWRDSFSTRPVPSNMSWCTVQGVPFEICVALSNQINASCWTNWSANVTDADVASTANLIINGTGMQSGYSALNSNLNWYNEWMNEGWNGTYIGYHMAGSFGSIYWNAQTPGGNNSQWSANYRGMRTAVIAELIKTAIGATPFNKVYPMLNSQAAAYSNTSWTTPYWTSAIDGYVGPATAHPLKCIGIAPYMGGGVGGAGQSVTDANTILAASSTNQLTAFFQCFTTQTTVVGTLSSVPSTGWLGQTLGWIQSYVSGLSSYSTLALIGYEGGTQFSVGTLTGTAGTNWLALMTSAESDSRMDTAYSSWLSNWASTVGVTSTNILCPLQSCLPCTTYGDEGIIQSTMQTLSPLSAAPPKFQAVQNYIGSTTASTPTFSPVAGTYASAQSVTISCATTGSTIYYTIDGTTPTTSSTVYSSPVVVSSNTTVQAIATAAGYTQSAVGSAAYVITGGPTFNYYVSPTGSDSNSGTVGSPWAITSLMMATQNAHNVANFALTRGQRVGFLPGTYNISTYMGTDSYTGAFQIDSGTSSASTYYGSSNSGGAYVQGTATITALTTGGLPGGGTSNNGPILGGCTNTPHLGGWVTVDGLIFTGFTYKAIRFGGVSASDGPAITGNVAIQNCTFTGQLFQSGASPDNNACIWLDGTATVGAGGSGNYQITNNYFYNNTPNGTDYQHLSAIFLFNSAAVSITYNTCVNAGTLAWGKDSANQGTTVAYNYVDVTATASGSGADQLYGFSDFTGAYGGTTGLTLASTFHHNIIVTNGWGFGLRGAASNEAWQTPLTVYNNTVVMVAGGLLYPAVWANTTTGNEGTIQIYNNILTGPADASGYDHLLTSAKALSICDYNGEPSGTMSWALVAPGAGNTVTGSYSSTSTFATAVAGAGGISAAESHSVASNSPDFTNSGVFAQLYQLQSGSPFKNVGSATGASGGASCDMGAWGGATVPTQIGCSFA